MGCEHRGGRLASFIIVKDDCEFRASVNAGILVADSIETDPAPPVFVMEPLESIPSLPIGSATIAFVASLVRK